MIWEQDNMLWEQDNILMEQDNLFFVAWPYYFYYICDKRENKKKLLTNKHLNKNIEHLIFFITEIRTVPFMSTLLSC